MNPKNSATRQIRSKGEKGFAFREQGAPIFCCDARLLSPRIFT